MTHLTVICAAVTANGWAYCIPQQPVISQR